MIMEREMQAFNIFFAVSMCILLALLVLIFIMAYRSYRREKEIRGRYDKVSKIYEILLDGNKVVANTINIDWYNIEIDDAQRRVFLTARKD